MEEGVRVVKLIARVILSQSVAAKAPLLASTDSTVNKSCKIEVDQTSI